MSAGMARDTHVMVNAITPLGITIVNVHLACMVMAREVAVGFASSQLLLQVINVIRMHPLLTWQWHVFLVFQLSYM